MTDRVYSADECLLTDPVLIWQTVFTVLTSVCWLTLCWYDRLCLQCWSVSVNWPCVNMTDCLQRWPLSNNWPCVDMTDCFYSANQCMLTDPVLIWQTVFTVLTSVCWLTLCWYDNVYSADQRLLSDPVLIWQTVFTVLTSVCWLTLCWYDRLCLQCWPVSADWPCADMADHVYSADQCLLTDPVLCRWLCLQCWPVSAILALTWF